MLGKTSLYAVARQGTIQRQDSQSEVYHRPHHFWTIIVESHPLLGVGKADIVEYCATWNEGAGHHEVHEIALGGHDSILGSILVSDSTHLNQKDAHSLLRERFEHKSSNLDADSDSEEWLRQALHALQSNKIVDKFDVDSFIAFSNGYIATRQQDGSDVPGTIAYPDLHPEHKEKARKHGFWVTYPETANNRTGEKIYGNLM